MVGGLCLSWPGPFAFSALVAPGASSRRAWSFFAPVAPHPGPPGLRPDPSGMRRWLRVASSLAPPFGRPLRLFAHFASSRPGRFAPVARPLRRAPPARGPRALPPGSVARPCAPLRSRLLPPSARRALAAPAALAAAAASSGRPSAAFGLPSVALVRSVAPVGSSRRPPGPPQGAPAPLRGAASGPRAPRGGAEGRLRRPFFRPRPAALFLLAPACGRCATSLRPLRSARRSLPSASPPAPLPSPRPPLGAGGDARPRHRCGGDEGRPLRECPSTPAAGIIPPVSRAARVAFGHP